MSLLLALFTIFLKIPSEKYQNVFKFFIKNNMDVFSFNVKKFIQFQKLIQ